MMAAADHPVASGFLPLLETLEDGGVGGAEQTDAYLTIANRLRGEHGRLFLPVVQKHFTRLAAAALTHMSSVNVELGQAALQALGFCVFHHQLASTLTESLVLEVLATLCSLVVKSPDKNTCTRALWVISKQSFPQHTVIKQVPSILETLESVWTREAVHSVVMEHEALNVIISLLEQVPVQMGEGAVQWARMVVPLVVHQAPKLRLRAAAALETGMSLLLEKQTAVAAIIEPMMATKLVPELQKLFMSKNETNVLKLWPLFVRLLGKLLHRGGPFINSLLHLEELGFRSSSPSVKKIAFIAWKSLIDNFALNPDILCSAKRMKLLLQPLVSINVRTEALLLTKVEVWWYLVVRLGANLSANFDQVSVPLLQCTLGSNSSSSSSSRSSTSATPKTGFSSPANSSRMSLNSSLNSSVTSSVTSSFPSVRLLALEMLLHYLVGPEVDTTASKNHLVLSLEPLTAPLLSGSSSFSKHSTPLISNLRDAFISLGREAPENMLTAVWRNLVRVVNTTIESAGGGKKERHSGEVLTQMLQALQDIVTSEALPPQTVLVLLKVTVDGIPRRVLGSASYQVGKMDVLNGTPALFLLLLLYNSSLLPTFVQDQRFFPVLRALVSCGLSGPTSPLAFSEALLGAVGGSAAALQDPETLWKMWSAVVEPLTDTITQSNEVNQGDALEHNFNAVLAALMLPVTHFLHGAPLSQASQKAMLASWSRLYRTFARCAALVATAEENVCCEELSAKMLASLDRHALKAEWVCECVAVMLQVMVDSVDFSPYTPHFQHKLKSPHTPVGWTRRRTRALGNLSSFRSLLVRCLDVHLEATPPAGSEATPSALISVVSALFANLVLADAVQDALTSLVAPLTQLYGGGEDGSPLQAKLEKLQADILGCLRSRTSIPFDEELLAVLSPLLCVLLPHKNKVLRLAAAHFWNATFANATALTYPDQLRPVLMQVKQRTPIILPGFEAVGGGSDELAGMDSSESSQMDTRISGIPVSSGGLRDVGSGLAAEPRDQNSTRTSKAVSTKLDFGSPKPPRREVLEEEASVDFVFIPPEAKERVLTEHQKEVKRTKRVDIPAMYNNLDASLDTAVFTQYTQSQEDSLDKLPTEQLDAVARDAPGEGAQEDVEMIEGSDCETTTDSSSGKAEEKEEVNAISEAVDSPEEEPTKNETSAAGDVDVVSKEDTSLDVSASSDLVSGTPQKSNSRRQSFITLEKYQERKSASPSGVSPFTGPLEKSSNSQKGNSHQSPERSQSSPTVTQESPKRPKESHANTRPVKLTERLPSGESEDDVVPDTQEGLENKDALKSVSEEWSSQEEDSEAVLDVSQSSTTSSDEPRRSGRSRAPPSLPGEDPEEREAKYTQFKRKRSRDVPNPDSSKSGETQSRPNTRSKQAAEERGSRLRTRSQRDSNQSNSQNNTRKKTKLFNFSEDFLGKYPGKRKSSSDLESSQTDNERELQARKQNRMSKALSDDKQEHPKKNRSSDKLELSSKEEPVKQVDEDSDMSDVPQTVRDSKEPEQDEPETEVSSSSPLDQSQEFGKQENDAFLPLNEIHEEDSQPVNEERTENLQEKVESKEESLSQEDSQVSTSTSSDSQVRRRSSRSKPTPSEGEVPESGNKRDSLRRRSNSQQTPSDPPRSEGLSGGRTTRSRTQEDSGPTRRRSTPVASSVESRSSTGQDGSVGQKKRGRARASLQSPLNPEESKTGSSLKVGDVSQNKDTQSSEENKTLKDSSQTEQSQGHEMLSDSVPEEARMETVGSLQETSVTQNQPVKSTEASMEEDSTKNIEEAESEKHDEKEQLSADSSDTAAPPGGTTDNQLEAEENQSGGEPVGTLKAQPEGDLTELAVAHGGPGEMESQEYNASAVELVKTEPLQEMEVVEEKVETVQGEVEALQEEVEALQKEVEALQEEEVESLQEEVEAIQEEVETLQEEVEALKDKVEPLQEKETLQEDPRSSPSEDVAQTSSGNLCDAVVSDSPVKQKDLETVMAAEAGQSPGGGRTRGTWSPSASPSTSILKKCQKRSIEADSPSPLVKSRRVSFANPIQHQETADDIDRRSPALRTSSPRRSRVVTQPKLITTPTKGITVLSPRTLHGHGFRSSKKSLISALSEERRPVSKDCVYPALLRCSAPVEAVLPQIASNMWSRGFGQLIRARNIKTVGDLSALSLADVKTLPIRSPKVSTVRKALQSFHQQRRGRGEEQKSFDDTELMTTEESGDLRPPEDDKTTAEPLATELVDESVNEPDASEDQTLDASDGQINISDGQTVEVSDGQTDVADGQTDVADGQTVEVSDGQAGDRLRWDVEALSCSMTPQRLRLSSPQELVDVHHQLGDMMQRVVLELQTRLQQTRLQQTDQ